MDELTVEAMNVFEQAIITAEQQPFELLEIFTDREEAWETSPYASITDEEGYHLWKCFRENGKIIWVNNYMTNPERDPGSAVDVYVVDDPRKTLTSKRKILDNWEQNGKPERKLISFL